MIKKLFVAASLLIGGISHGASIVILQGDLSDFGKKFFAGFSSVVTENIKAFQYDISKDRAIMGQIKSLQPDLILTIGKAPVEALVNLMPSTPFIVSDYFSPSLQKKPNVVLVEQTPPTDIAIDLMLKFVPTAKTIGTIYNPQYSQDIFTLLVKSATKKNIQVSSIKASNPEDVASYIAAFAEKINVYVAIRDITLSHPTATEAVFNFSKAKNIPVVSLDPTHMLRPTLFTLSTDPVSLGIQAWNISKIILKDKKIPQLSTRLEPIDLTVALSLTGISNLPTGLQGLPRYLQELTDLGYTVRVGK